MKNKIKYTNDPIEAKVINDFLPWPDKLITREKNKRVTLTLSQHSLDFFKEAAKRHNAPYQGMIRRLIDYYVANQQSL